MMGERALFLKGRIQPVEVIAITGQNAEHFQLVPLAAQHDNGHPADQESAGSQVERRIGVERDRRKSEKESQAGYGLGVVLQRMPDHRAGYGQKDAEVD